LTLSNYGRAYRNLAERFQDLCLDESVIAIRPSDYPKNIGTDYLAATQRDRLRR
jgi:hypothetical protein